MRRDGDDNYIFTIFVFIIILMGLFTFNSWGSLKGNQQVEKIVNQDTTSIKNTPCLETYELLALPYQSKGKFKSYMDYRTITDVSSKQFELQRQAYTDEYGYRRVGDNYMIALGSAYGTEIGTKYYVTLDNGLTFPALLGDCKADIHTDVTNRYVEHNGNIVEFIVDTPKLQKTAKIMGDVSYGGFKGEIIQILKVESEEVND